MFSSARRNRFSDKALHRQHLKHGVTWLCQMAPKAQMHPRTLARVADPSTTETDPAVDRQIEKSVIGSTDIREPRPLKTRISPRT